MPAVPTVVADRFEIETRVAEGGMGIVYRARDRETGGRVALKLVQLATPELARRFAIEARVLAQLRHPAIVGYVADGLTPAGERWMAMEWLEGEDLSVRLVRAGLDLDETVRLGARLAEALAFAHERGVIHRDLKPSNVFLPGGRIDEAKLLDFGVARLIVDAPQLTRTGAAIGTPAYMAPEQARATQQIDPRADLFSLGCVLFECAAGRPPFVGQNPMAVMAKILLEDAPRLRSLRADAPAALDELCAALLEKDRARRPADARTVALALRDLPSAGAAPGSGPPARSAAPAITDTENQLVCVVLAREAEGEPDADGAAAPAGSTPHVTGGGKLTQLAALAERWGARLEPMLDGSLCAVVTGAGAAVDLCARAARLSLGLRALLPGAPLALATGRTLLRGALPVGDVIERAAEMVGRPGAGVRVDEVTAGLLAASFRVRDEPDGALLERERDFLDEGRRLLGKPTPCVGRDRELDLIEASLAECLGGGVARAVLVTGPAGVGKSRLRQECLRRFRARHTLSIWLGRGDPMRKGSSFAVLADALRKHADVLETDEPEAARRKLAGVVARAVDAGNRARVAGFLGELCGLPFPDEGLPQLRAARENPMLMGDQLRRAWEDLVRAQLARGPLVLVLEDLHFGDLPTVSFVDAALRAAREQPLFVLALARPEIEQEFPRLWRDRPLTHVRLGELSRADSAALVGAVLGDDVDAGLSAQIVEQAGGNAFYLEELIRAVAAGHGRDAPLPGSVLAMAQSRLESLPEGHRRVLRAGAVYGEALWPAGVAALLGEGTGEAEVLALCARLVESEILVKRAEPRFPDEHAFRHNLLREAAYAMLPDQDRALGHRLAAEWLEGRGERDAMVLASHYERGAAPRQAVKWYVRAAEQALEANDLAAVVARAARAAELGAQGKEAAALRLAEATALHWQARYAESERAATFAMRGLQPLSQAWYRAVEEVAEACMPLGKVERLITLAEALHPPPRLGPASATFVIGAATLAMQLALAGQKDAATRLVARLEATLVKLPDAPPLVRARVEFARGTLAMMSGDVGGMLDHARAAVPGFDAAGDLRNACLMRSNLGYAHIEVGEYEDAVAVLREASGLAERTGNRFVAALSLQNLGAALSRLGAHDEALAVEQEATRLFESSDDRRLSGLSRAYVAAIWLGRQDLEAAEREARAAVATLESMPPTRAYALAVLSHVLRRAGRADDALAAAQDGARQLEGEGGIDEGEALLRLALVQALLAVGREDDAHAALRDACARLERRALDIQDPRHRQAFLTRVSENAETVAMARAAGLPVVWTDGSQ